MYASRIITSIYLNLERILYFSKIWCAQCSAWAFFLCLLIPWICARLGLEIYFCIRNFDMIVCVKFLGYFLSYNLMGQTLYWVKEDRKVKNCTAVHCTAIQPQLNPIIGFQFVPNKMQIFYNLKMDQCKICGRQEKSWGWLDIRFLSSDFVVNKVIIW